MDPKNLTVEEAVWHLPKNVAREYIERKIEGALCNDHFLGLVEEHLKTKKGVTYDQLVKLDSEYFDPKYADEESDYTNKEAAYRLATWLFDNEGDETRCRKKAKEQLSHVYLEMLENFVDGNHDT